MAILLGIYPTFSGPNPLKAGKCCWKRRGLGGLGAPKDPSAHHVELYLTGNVANAGELEDVIWVNYNDLTVLPHWEWWLVREIIPIWP